MLVIIIVSGTEELFISTNTTRTLDGGTSWTWYVTLDTVKLALNTESVTYIQTNLHVLYDWIQRLIAT